MSINLDSRAFYSTSSRRCLFRFLSGREKSLVLNYRVRRKERRDRLTDHSSAAIKTFHYSAGGGGAVSYYLRSTLISSVVATINYLFLCTRRTKWHSQCVVRLWVHSFVRSLVSMDGLRNFCSPSQCAAAPFLPPPLTLPFILVQTCSLHNPIPVSCSTLYAVPMHTQQTGGGGHSGAYSTPSPVPRSPGRQELRLLLILLLNGFLSCSSIN